MSAPTPAEIRLRAENRDLRGMVKALSDQVIALQAANEGAYREQYDAAGGPRFDKLRPFGHLTERCFPDSARRAAVRMLQNTTGGLDADTIQTRGTRNV